MRTSVCRIAVGLFLFSTLSLPPAALAGVDQPPTATTPPADSDLPWKPVASPEGILPLGDYPAKFKAFSDSKKFAETKRVIEDLLDKTVRKSSPPILAKKDLVYAIHVVVFGDPVKTGDQAKSAAPVQSNAWYIYHNNISFNEFMGQRVFGSRNVVVLFFHVNAKGLLNTGLLKDNCKALQEVRDAADAEDAKKGNPAGQNDALLCTAEEKKAFEESDDKKKQVNPRNIVFLGMGKLVDDSTKRNLRAIGDDALVDAYADVHYDAAVVKKVAANIQNLFSVLKLLGLVAQGKEAPSRRVVTEKVIVWGSGAIADMRVPSNVYLAGYGFPIDSPVPPEQKDSLRLGARGDLDNEGLYWWDASIGIPVHKIRDVQYSSADGTVEAKQVDKQSAYVMFNIMPTRIDIKNSNFNVWHSNLMPRILLGFPLSSSPWDRLFVGGGIGIPKLMLGNQFFAGVVFNRVSKPQTLAPGDPATGAELANDSRLRVERKLMIGINVPVMSVFERLK